LEIYETGTWLNILNQLEESQSPNITKWKGYMLEAISSFDEKAYTHLKALTARANSSE